MKDRQKLLTDEQWKLVGAMLPPPRQRADRRGRPPAPNRACFEGILWILQGHNRTTITLKEYFDAPESRRFEAGLDLAQVVFDWGVTPALLSLIGVPSVAVGLALVGIQYGYRRATDTNTERVGDHWS